MKDIKLSVKVNKAMADKLVYEAGKNDSNVSQVIRDAINLYFKERYEIGKDKN